MISSAQLRRLAAPIPDHQARKMTEKQYQKLITDLATSLGWWWHHTYDSRRSQQGWPDLTLLRGTRHLLLEVKTELGRLSDYQKDVTARLRLAGFDVRVARPSTWPDVVAALTRETTGGSDDPDDVGNVIDIARLRDAGL